MYSPRYSPSEDYCHFKRHPHFTSGSVYMGEHYCESCDRGWQTLEELEEHLSSHVKCEYEGCKFIAHPKIIAVHVKLQHLSGLFDKMKFTYTKEEIEKWKEERRRNFPTQKNIEEKLAALKEKEDRGERLEDNNGKLSRKFKNKGNQKLSQKSSTENEQIPKTNKRRKRSRRTGNEQNYFKRDIVMEEAKQVMKNLIIEEDKSSDTENEAFSDDEWNNESNTSNVIETETAPKVCGVLAALSAAYDSNSEDEQCDNEDITEANYVNTTPNNIDKDDEAPDEQSSKIVVDEPNFYVNENTENEDKKKTKLIKCNKNLEKNNRKLLQKKVIRPNPKKFKKPTLLEMLLANEIKQERNYILQCVRFIINNNYFNDDNKSCLKNGNNDGGVI